jgi:hypothetical protein
MSEFALPPLVGSRSPTRWESSSSISCASCSSLNASSCPLFTILLEGVVTFGREGHCFLAQGRFLSVSAGGRLCSRSAF